MLAPMERRSDKGHADPVLLVKTSLGKAPHRLQQASLEITKLRRSAALVDDKLQ